MPKKKDDTAELLKKLNERWKDPAVRAADMKRSLEEWAESEALPDPIRAKRVYPKKPKNG